MKLVTNVRFNASNSTLIIERDEILVRGQELIATGPLEITEIPLAGANISLTQGRHQDSSGNDFFVVTIQNNGLLPLLEPSVLLRSGVTRLDLWCDPQASGPLFRSESRRFVADTQSLGFGQAQGFTIEVRSRGEVIESVPVQTLTLPLP